MVNKPPLDNDYHLVFFLGFVVYIPKNGLARPHMYMYLADARVSVDWLASVVQTAVAIINDPDRYKQNQELFNLAFKEEEDDTD